MIKLLNNDNSEQAINLSVNQTFSAEELVGETALLSEHNKARVALLNFKLEKNGCRRWFIMNGAGSILYSTGWRNSETTGLASLISGYFSITSALKEFVDQQK